MELKSDAFQIIIGGENNRTQKLLPDDLVNRTTILVRREKKRRMFDKQEFNEKMKVRYEWKRNACSLTINNNILQTRPTTDPLFEHLTVVTRKKAN